MHEENEATRPATTTGGQTAEVAVLAGGCFWGVEEILREVPGVLDTEVGYTGGWLENPKYEDTHDGKSGHAEAVRITFDPAVLGFEELLERWFFRLHDPTTLNRQGADVGTQYRSALFYHDEEQKKVAEEVIADLGSQGIWSDPIVTEVVPFERFYVAEDYHQNYFASNGYQPYCQVIIAPKVAKFRREHLERLKA